ncbi:MAG TPA: hypothetical protein PK186_08770 [candidate division Zixibacteria bacterium]|nr:hypothetical protein [candidate division Zixibacteria bacterium]MDD4916328.1 hypothetical protein [candidate division Zixibacteria bacterium]MDM7971844.1 hypothetical protein [candidate division Zixibacteria bacterium]HOD65691.1 hypothetical protein [candidate division Zixibacteria bacterium]HPM37633.1 hypothetical protein [candidate division Zixibacteria bacterium]
MPCKDITDTVKLTVAPDDRVVDYRLFKRTCGGTVGEDKLIGPWLFRRTAAQVAATRNEDFLAKLRAGSDITEYLAVKHFAAVRAALQAALGLAAGRVGDYCTIEAVEYGPEGMAITAHLAVKGLTDEIAACRNCCGRNRSGEETFGV